MKGYECLTSKFLFYLEGKVEQRKECDSPVCRQLPNLHMPTQLLLLILM